MAETATPHILPDRQRPMKICFYAPFKPLGHANPSGDLAIATGLYHFLRRRGHQVQIASRLRCRWLYWKPWRWPALAVESARLKRRLAVDPVDCWLSYHTYYKAPDMLGPQVAAQHKIPYVIFQASYATKYRRHFKTRPGFYLNRRALAAAHHVFTNRRTDWHNLQRVLSAGCISYVPSGLRPQAFRFDARARSELRRRWQAGDQAVILSVAMFRPGVKSDGLAQVIHACAGLLERGPAFKLVIVGDGRRRRHLEELARAQANGHVHFAGQIPREQLYRYYSAADIFAFPGIRESFGMVYIEAQSCGLPVVAFDTAGVPQAVRNGKTGLLVPENDAAAFADAMQRLLLHAGLRRRMGRQASAYVRQHHDLDRNYRKMEHKLAAVVSASRSQRPQGQRQGVPI